MAKPSGAKHGLGGAWLRGEWKSKGKVMTRIAEAQHRDDVQRYCIVGQSKGEAKRRKASQSDGTDIQ